MAGGRWLLDAPLDRRTLLKGASGAAISALVAACAPPASPPSSPGVAATPSPPSQAAAETVYVFNVGSKDVTLIDAASRAVRETRPLGAAVRWLSNEQSYWDGQLVWTYDFPDNKLQAIAIDPRAVAVTRTIPELGNGPGHSLMLLPGGKKAAINVAGDNLIAVIDVASGELDRKVDTGKFPCDLHFAPGARFAYTPERDQDTLSKIDLETWQIVRTVPFPAGSKPHMLRVSPDGKEVWVQTADAGTNVVLDADDLSVLATQPTGKTPVTNAWTPDRRYSLVTNGGDTFASVFDARTFKEVKRLSVGQGGSNIGFSKDGRTAFIAVTGANAVAAVDLAKLDVIGQIKAGAQPQGLIVL